MTKADFLFMMLRSELWGEKIEPFEMTQRQYRSLMDMADMQTVMGLLCDSLITNGVKLTKYDAIETFTLQNEIANKNDCFDNEVVDLCRLLKSHQLRFFVMKGQTLAEMYRHPKTRTAGDIDFYCYPEDFQRAVEVIEREWKVEMDRNNEEHHYIFERHDVTYEMHNVLLCLYSSKCMKYFEGRVAQSSLETIRIKDEDVPVLDFAFNFVYTFMHMFNHLMQLGVGLRHFVDMLAMCDYWACMKDEDHKRQVAADIAKHLDALGYRKGFEVVGNILVEKLGLPRLSLPVSSNRGFGKKEQDVLNIVFSRGNFGKYGRQNAVRSGWAYNLEAFFTKISLQRSVFSMAPKENLAYVTKAIPQKIFDSFRRGWK